MVFPTRLHFSSERSVLLRCWAVCLLALAVLALGACSKKEAFKNTDITGSALKGDFSLQDPDGKTRTLADFKGKAVVMFFGYTQCPDVCPTTLAEMAQTMQLLGADADKVQVLFVTIDPDRDTAELLKNYVPAFDKRFLGLRGNKEQLETLAKGLRVFYQKVDGKTPESYTMDHTAGSYVFDQKGELRLLIRHGGGAEPLAHDLKMLLQ